MTPAEFKARLPEFAAELDATIQVYLTNAEPMLDVARWGDFYSAGIAYIVAHELVIGKRRAVLDISDIDAEVQSASVGDVSFSKNALVLKMQMENPYYSTSYGRQYIRLAKLVGSGALAV